MPPAISVIIPTYNRPQALHKAIESVLAQTLVPLEILICEDGTTAVTEQLVASIGNQTVKWLPGPYTGRPAIPRNRGIRAARGEWLAFLDDDDIWLPEKLSRQMDLVRATHCRAACANAWRVQSGKRQDLYFSQPMQGKINFKQLLQSNLVICSSVIIHHSLVGKVEGFPEAETLLAVEDYALWLRVAAVTDFAYSSKPLLDYTDEPFQSIRKQGATDREQNRRVLRNFSDWLKIVRLPYFGLKVKLAFWRSKKLETGEK